MRVEHYDAALLKVLGILYADGRAIEAVGIRALPVAVKADSAASADVGVGLAQ